MRARTHGRIHGGLRIGFAAAVWLWAGQLALGQTQAYSPQRIEETYRKILADWSSGKAEAPDELIELETAVIVDGDPKTRKLLLQGEQAVIHQIGGADIEVLVPIAVLHHESYRRLLAQGGRGRAMAMHHARSMTRDLAILYREQSGSEGAGMVASRVLTSLGGLLLEAFQQLPAAEMFQQAVVLDGRNVLALMSLASIYEKNGDAEGTVKMLRQLLEVEPAHPEARLRLALNLKRLEKHDEAQKTLEALTKGEELWLTPLAYQELARLHSDRDKLAAAEKVLRDALERYPEDSRFYIQLAAVLDRQGSAKESSALIDKVLAASNPQRQSPARYLYNAARPEAFAEARSFLEENSRSRLPVLAQALNAPPAAAGATGVGR